MRTDRRFTQRWHRGDEGAFIVLFAMLIVAMLAMVAIVVDLGQYREARRIDQSASDLATLAAVKVLAGDDTGPGSPRDACNAALDYVLTNLKGVPSGTPNPCSGFPNSVPSPCPATGQKLSTSTPGGRYTIVFEYPVPDADINDPNRGGSGEFDGTNACERFLVQVSRDNPSFFASVIGISNQTISAKAVGRGFGVTTGQTAPALLILDRTTCQALSSSGRQASVHAQGFQTSPGYIHVNSDASNGNCPATPNTSNASDWTTYGLSLTGPTSAARGITAAITVDGAETGIGANPPRDPLFTVVATHNVAAKTSSNGAGDVGVSPTPTSGAPRASRSLVDSRYLSYIQALRTQTAGLGPVVTSGTVAPDGNPYVQLSSVYPGCNVPDNGTANGNFWFDCNPNISTNRYFEFTGAYFITANPLAIGNNRTLTFTNPKQIVVNNASPSNPGVAVTGTLNINTGSMAAISSPPPNYCQQSRSSAATTNTTMVVIKAGGLRHQVSGAQSRLCETTFYMSHVDSPTPENALNADLALVDVANGALDWSAPNQQAGPACLFDPTNLGCYDQTQPANQFEDLAFWTEASGTGGPGVNGSVTSGNFITIGGGGSVSTTGVFFSPNAHVQYAGQALSAVGSDAQFICRSLYLAGQANMLLRPNPNNSVPNRDPQYGLIR